jgi:hypothetical protein
VRVPGRLDHVTGTQAALAGEAPAGDHDGRDPAGRAVRAGEGGYQGAGAVRRELMTRPEAMVCRVMSRARLNGVAKPMLRAGWPSPRR